MKRKLVITISSVVLASIIFIFVMSAKNSYSPVSTDITKYTNNIITYLEKKDYDKFNKYFPDFYENMIVNSDFEISFGAYLDDSDKINRDGYNQIINQLESLCIEKPVLISKNKEKYMEYLANLRIRASVYHSLGDEVKGKQFDQYITNISNEFLENIKKELSAEFTTHPYTS